MDEPLMFTLCLKNKKLYLQTRTCSNCKKTESRNIDKKTAAFESTRKWKTPCPHCNCNSFESSSDQTPPIDEELLKIWTQSNNLYFLDQDEDIIIAEPENFELFKKYVKDKSIHVKKRGILLSAICIILFDNTPEDENDLEKYDLTIAVKVREFLINNKVLFNEIDNINIMEYIRKVVYPQIEMK